MHFIMSFTDRDERRNYMAARKEMVLYYTPEKTADDQKLKGVLVRLGIRIRNIGPEQVNQTVGYLAGLAGFEEQPEEGMFPEIPEKMLVLYGFGERKLGEMLNQLRKAKVPPIAMKAVLTEHNCGWSFYELYRELRQEHEKMSAGSRADHAGIRKEETDSK